MNELPVNVCLLKHPHGAHDWWYTSSGGGHMLNSFDPQEKNCKQHWCPGVKAKPELSDVARLEKMFRVMFGVQPTADHFPVGAYLPLGQLDGDCVCGQGPWPCDTLSSREAMSDSVRARLTSIREAVYHEPCCTHEGDFYGNCTDCQNTGCAHRQYVDDPEVLADIKWLLAIAEGDYRAE